MLSTKGRGIIICMVTLLGGLTLVYEGENNLYKLLGIIITLIGITLFTFHHGTQIDFNTKRIRGYSSFFGKKFGSWESLSNYTHLAIMATFWAEQQDGNPHGYFNFHERGLYVFNASTKRKSLIKSYNNPEKLMDGGRELSKKLNLEILFQE